MKKFLVCVLVLTLGLSCTKEDPMTACGCSPVQTPEFRLIVKDANNNDLLDPTRSGSFTKEKIKITYKEAGVSKNASFIIRQPFSYGENLKNKFPFNQLISSEIAPLRIGNKATEFFIDLGDGQQHSLTFDFNQIKGHPENVRIDGTPSAPEESLPEQYGKIYYIVK